VQVKSFQIGGLPVGLGALVSDKITLNETDINESYEITERDEV
jgi:hypothetical protein